MPTKDAEAADGTGRDTAVIDETKTKARADGAAPKGASGRGAAAKGTAEKAAAANYAVDSRAGAPDEREDGAGTPEAAGQRDDDDAVDNEVKDSSEVLNVTGDSDPGTPSVKSGKRSPGKNHGVESESEGDMSGSGAGDGDGSRAGSDDHRPEAVPGGD